ncbi:hypothetical protein PRIPAC_76679, partial [Pristionchus pacificus]
VVVPVVLAMFFDDSSTRSFDDNNDYCMNEECDGTNSDGRVTPPPNLFSGLPGSPCDSIESCLLIVEEQRHHIHSITCSPASSSCSSASTSPPVVRAFSHPPKRINWRDHMRDLHRATIEESIHRLTSMRGGIEKKKRGKGGHVGTGARRSHRPGCAMHVWSLVKHIKEQSASDCNCQKEISGVSSDLVDRLRRLTRFDSRPHHQFTYSYKLNYSLPSISEDSEEGGDQEGAASQRETAESELFVALTNALPRPEMGRVSRSVSPPPSRPHCSSPAEDESQQQLQPLQHPPVLSEEEMCARLSALPIGYHTTATVAALESALHSSLTLMDAD